ncbi:MAG: pyruvate ferredoxin oxidoreductase [Armatimonadetes bacterium]|nr:pyruvate ferredoxin oxidoreductase [Armatimonadota bacterium]MDW8122753.1 pyruvate ferredoxin oxidoreductase [Armatimonadota bacterium]
MSEPAMPSQKVEEVSYQILALSGNEAQALAMKQINPHMVAAYPITPQTEIVMTFAQYVADGLVETEFVSVESEHSAMSACIGGAASGARTMTATSAQGLAYMWELLPIASAMRLPIVMAVVARALSANLNIHCDHSDVMGARDSGWIILFCEDPQEAYDTLIQAVVIAERAKLPVMVVTDGFVISHAVHPVRVLPDEAVRHFVGAPQPAYSLLNVDQPITVGPVDLPDYFMEHRRQLTDAILEALPIVQQVGQEFADNFHTKPYGLIETFQTEDADVILVGMGSFCGTAQAAVEKVRREGQKAGLVKVRAFRPFPQSEIFKALRFAKVIGVMDRADSLSGTGGPLFTDIRAAFYDRLVTLKPQAVTSLVPCPSPKIVNAIYGLGGRDVTVPQIYQFIMELFDVAAGKTVSQTWRYLGVRE